MPNITLNPVRVTPTDIGLFTVWISPGNPASVVRTTDIYLYDPTLVSGKNMIVMSTGKLAQKVTADFYVEL